MLPHRIRQSETKQAAMPNQETVFGDQPEQMSIQGQQPSTDTPEAVRFRQLPQDLQRRLLQNYPRALATAMHQYSEGTDCESILMQLFDSTAEMLTARNPNGDNPLASALERGQTHRAKRLVGVAEKRNPKVLEQRAGQRESLLMLSTSCSGELIERLLLRDPTQLHRLYDNDGRNFLHHCALEGSIESLNVGLSVTKRLLEESRLVASQVAAALHMNDSWGSTPMHMMAARNRGDMLFSMVQFAREAGVGLNLDERQHTGDRRTPLMCATTVGAIDAVRVLLDCGADPTEEDGSGATAADLATGYPQLLELFPAWDNTCDSTCDSSSESDAHMQLTEDEESKEDCMEVAEADSCCGGDTGAWLKAGRRDSIGAVDSGVCSVMSTAAHVSHADQAGSFAQDEVYSEVEFEQLEKHLAARGKSEQFLNSLSRRDSRFTVNNPLAFMTVAPIKAAVGIWAASGLRVPKRLVLEAVKEVDKRI